MFSLKSLNSETKIFVIIVKGLKPATSCIKTRMLPHCQQDTCASVIYRIHWICWIRWIPWKFCSILEKLHWKQYENNELTMKNSYSLAQILSYSPHGTRWLSGFNRNPNTTAPRLSRNMIKCPSHMKETKTRILCRWGCMCLCDRDLYLNRDYIDLSLCFLRHKVLSPSFFVM